MRNAPARSAAVVAPSNVNDLAKVTRGLMVTVSGNVKVDMVDTGTAIVLPLTAGLLYPICVTRVYATDTTATGIIAFW